MRGDAGLHPDAWAHVHRTVGTPGMNIPPLDLSGARGEHFHSLVDRIMNPQIFVINDNSRAYPGMLLP